MTDPMPTIMQAAERLIRVQSGEKEVAVYWPLVKERTGSQYLNRRLVDAARRDDERLVLSAILPKGKRPVAIETPPEGTMWVLDSLNRVCGVTFCSSGAKDVWTTHQHTIGETGFATPHEAETERRYKMLEHLQKPEEAAPLAS